MRTFRRSPFVHVFAAVFGVALTAAAAFWVLVIGVPLVAVVLAPVYDAIGVGPVVLAFALMVYAARRAGRI